MTVEGEYEEFPDLATRALAALIIKAGGSVDVALEDIHMIDGQTLGYQINRAAGTLTLRVKSARGE